MTLTKTARACLITGVFSAGVAVAAGPSLATAAADVYKDVVVRNSETQPIPTKPIGTTKVDATGQTLTISGFVNATGSKVDVTGSTIKVQGDPGAAPIPVEVTNQAASAPTAKPLSKVFVLDTRAGTKFRVAQFDVPATENWRIDHIAVHQPDFREGTAAPVDSVYVESFWSDPSGFTAISGTDHAAFSQDVKLYATARSLLHIAAGWLEETDRKGLVLVTLTGEKTEASPSTAAAAAAERKTPPTEAEILRRLSGRE